MGPKVKVSGGFRQCSHGTHIVAAKVGLQLSSKNLEGGTLSDTVGTDKAEHLARARGGETVKLERVRGVTMCDLRIEVGRQVDDSNGFEGASIQKLSLLRAHFVISAGKRGRRTSLRRYRNQYTGTLR